MAERKLLRQVLGERREIHRFEGGRDAAGFDACEVEQRIDQLEQAQRIAMRDVELRADRRGQLAGGERVFQRSQHQRQRRAELVADVREEGGLGAIDFRQRRGAPAFFFVGARIGDGGGDLRADQLEETGVQLVEPHARADADHQRAGGLVREVGPDRHHGHGPGSMRRSADA